MEATPLASPPPAPPRKAAPRDAHRTSRGRLLADKLARWSVTGGGLAIIGSILGILLFIVAEVYPLLGGAEVRAGRKLAVAGAQGGAVRCDEYRERAAVLGRDGRLAVVDLVGGAVLRSQPLLPGDDAAGGSTTLRAVRGIPGAQALSGATADGRIVAVPLRWQVEFVGDRRVVRLEPPEPIVFELDPRGLAVGPFAVGLGDEAASAVARLADGSLALLRRETEENLFSGEVTAYWRRSELPVSGGPLELLVFDAAQRNLYGGGPDGRLVWWNLDGEAPSPPQVVGGGAAVTALTLLIGDRSLVVGREDGSLEVWFPVRQDDRGSFDLTRIRELPALPEAVVEIVPSLRNKGFVARDASGQLGLYHSTSRRLLWRGEAPLRDPHGMFFSPKSDGLLLVADDRLAELEIDNPHPEVSLGSLFGKVWYESYEEPAFVWQSSGGTDDFEPKLSLTPLMLGTLKGTVYSLFLAIPLGVLGAMYTSQFMHPRLKRFVKPTVEIMAALPSVVLGFLAGLWLAPRIEGIMPALFLMLLVLPVIVVLAGLGWRVLPVGIRGRYPAGSEALLYMIVLALGIWLCLVLNDAVESSLFGGSFQTWLLETTGLPYDQRNAVVVGLAMGFAVIPIIFSIAEDAFSNVPNNLISGSLALGANRWQTVTQVVLPTASPGIFSAIMIGFGRAVGETMIVLMATGNTPILDWNPFNGFRTLSANIAVEIPEAPQGATLYRTLFLAALILFVFTFLINTVAELVRQRLRRRYAQL